MLLMASASVFAQEATPPEQVVAPVAESQATAAIAGSRCHPELAKRAPFAVPGMIVRNLRLQEGKSARLPFSTGESLVEVVQLPAFAKPYQVEFWLSFDMNLRKDNEVVVPSVALADENFCEIVDLGEPGFKSEASFLTGTRQTKGRIPVDSGKPRYALVYTDARRVGEPLKVRIDYSTMPFVRAGQGYVMVRLNK